MLVAIADISETDSSSFSISEDTCEHISFTLADICPTDKHIDDEVSFSSELNFNILSSLTSIDEVLFSILKLKSDYII